MRWRELEVGTVVLGEFGPNDTLSILLLKKTDNSITWLNLETGRTYESSHAGDTVIKDFYTVLRGRQNGLA